MTRCWNLPLEGVILPPSPQHGNLPSNSLGLSHSLYFLLSSYHPLSRFTSFIVSSFSYMTISSFDSTHFFFTFDSDILKQISEKNTWSSPIDYLDGSIITSEKPRNNLFKTRENDCQTMIIEKVLKYQQKKTNFRLWYITATLISIPADWRIVA